MLTYLFKCLSSSFLTSRKFWTVLYWKGLEIRIINAWPNFQFQHYFTVQSSMMGDGIDRLCHLPVFCAEIMQTGTQFYNNRWECYNVKTTVSTISSFLTYTSILLTTPLSIAQLIAVCSDRIDEHIIALQILMNNWWVLWIQIFQSLHYKKRVWQCQQYFLVMKMTHESNNYFDNTISQTISPN